MNSLYSLYYQAHVPRQYAWLLTAILRSYEHLAFDRTIDVENSIFEFFVAPGYDEVFCGLMNDLAQRGVIVNLVKLPNRMKQELV
jgi:hypothetical protein